MKLKRNNFDFAVEEAGCLLTIRNEWPKGPQEMARNDSSFSSRNGIEIRKWKVGGLGRPEDLIVWKIVGRPARRLQWLSRASSRNLGTPPLEIFKCHPIETSLLFITRNGFGNLPKHDIYASRFHGSSPENQVPYIKNSLSFESSSLQFI